MKILLTEDQEKEILSYEDLSDVVTDYYQDGHLSINPNIFTNKTHRSIFDGLMFIVDELKTFGIYSDDFMNYRNLGYNKKGRLSYFDIGFGDYYEDFEEHPHEVDLNELDLKLGDELTNKILNKFTKNKPIKLGEGGNFGVAYNIGDGKVLKITKDKTEAINSKKLIGKTTQHLANIYEVKFIKSNDNIFYIIILEMLDTTSEIHKSFVEMNEIIVKNSNNNFEYNIIDVIRRKHPIVAEFLDYMCKFGSDKTWKKYIEVVRKTEQYDFNDISEISEWIRGSITNDNQHTDEVPDHILQTLKTLLQ